MGEGGDPYFQPPTPTRVLLSVRKDIFWRGKWTTHAIGSWLLRILLCRSANSRVQHACPLLVLSQPGRERCAGLAPPSSPPAHQPQRCASAGTARACERALSWWTDPVAFFVVALGGGGEQGERGGWSLGGRSENQITMMRMPFLCPSQRRINMRSGCR